MAHELLTGIWVKIERAKKHFLDLETGARNFIAKHPYRIVIDEESEPGYILYKVHAREPIPPEFGGMVGDVIHNLRASLDNLATALVYLNGVANLNALKKVYFPIGASEEIFNDLLDRYLAKASPEVRRFVKRLKPYRGGTTAFRRLHELDILDKHTTIVPVGVSHTRLGAKFNLAAMFGANGEAVPELPFIFFSPARKIFPLNDGDVILRYGIGPDPERKYQPDFQFTFDIAFGEGQIVDGEPVLPALKNLINFTERVIAFFARTFFR